MIVVNDVDGDPVTLTGSGAVGIPAVMVSQSDGLIIVAGLPAAAVVAADS